jgi:hypothetical protein
MTRSIFSRLASLAALTIVALTLSHCKKSSGSGSGNNNNGNGYYMKFDLNGNPVDYGSDALAELSFSSSDGLYSAALIAYKDVNAGAKNAVTILAYSSSGIAANVGYNDPGKAAETNGAQVPQSTIFWYDSTGAAYLTAGEFADASGNMMISGAVADCKLTITELTNTDVKGTFSGTVYRTDFSTSDVITNGQFYLKREQ